MKLQSIRINQKKFIFLYIILIPLLIFGSCKPDPGPLDNDMTKLMLLQDKYIPLELENTCSGADYEYFFVDTPANTSVDLTYTLTLSTPKDVYFILTNTNTSTITNYPTIENQNLNNNINNNEDIYEPEELSAKSGGPVLQSGKPEISEFNRNPLQYIDIDSEKASLTKYFSLSAPLYDAVDDETSFTTVEEVNGIDTIIYIPATCRKVVNVSTAYGQKTLNVWVADDCWHDGGTKNYKVDATMVDELANKFLKDGGSYDNDIYDWVTNIFGEEWGSDASSINPNLIGSNDEITILLYDIDNDQATSSGVLGYFWSKDNFKNISYSNQRLMFYIDAIFFAVPEGSWEITDKSPSQIISTLAHEFQHMIHFYQKNVKRSTNLVGSEIWINEMCSMVTEDLLADKISADGPRGVVYYNASAGSSGNTKGRLPLYNYWNDAALAAWYNGNYALVSYAINYAFGAYLARNFDGAQFFKNVVYNSYVDYRAIEYALTQDSNNDGFGMILRKWAVANLLSDKTDTIDGYKYNNNSTWFPSSVGSITYNLGSINLYNYDYGSLTGPYIYTEMPTGNMPFTSNIYYKTSIGKLSGENRWNIKLRRNVKLSVVVK